MIVKLWLILLDLVQKKERLVGLYSSCLADYWAFTVHA